MSIYLKPKEVLRGNKIKGLKQDSRNPASKVIGHVYGSYRYRFGLCFYDLSIEYDNYDAIILFSSLFHTLLYYFVYKCYYFIYA